MKATEIIRARVPVELKHNFEIIAQYKGMSAQTSRSSNSPTLSPISRSPASSFPSPVSCT